MPKILTVALPYLAGLVLALFLFRSCEARAEAEGRYQAEREALQKELATAQAEAGRRDTVFRRDTVRLTAWRTRYDSTRLTDTVVVDSIVYVNRDVADSTVTACTNALQSCTSLLAAERSVAANLRQQIALERKRGVCKVAGFIPCPTRTAAAIGGVVVGAVVVGAVRR